MDEVVDDVLLLVELAVTVLFVVIAEEAPAAFEWLL